MSRRNHEVVFDENNLRQEILREAKVVGVPAGSAEVMAEKIARSVQEWVSQRAVVTEVDLNHKIALEAEKYSKDLAYVYQNRGKII